MIEDINKEVPIGIMQRKLKAIYNQSNLDNFT